MGLLLIILTISTLMTQRTLGTTISSSHTTLQTTGLLDNTTTHISSGSLSSTIFDSNTGYTTTTTKTDRVPKGGKSQTVVSTETKNLVLDVINCGLLPVVCLFGITGNIMSLVVLYIQGSQERTNVILVGLSLSDTLFLMMTIIRKISCLVGKVNETAGFDLSLLMQTQAVVLYIIFGRLTTAMTMLISIERFIAVYFPLKAHVLLTPTRIKFAVGFLYLLVCSAMAPLLALYEIGYVYSSRLQRRIPYPRQTQFYLDNEESIDTYLNQVLNIVFRYTPMIVVLTFTALIILRIKKSSSWRRQTSRHTKHDEDKVTNMLLLVNCIYIVCLMPGAISISLRFFIDGYNFDGTYANIFNLIGGIVILIEAINSSVNFVVYMVMSKKFSATYKRVFLCKRRDSKYKRNTATPNTNIINATSSSATIT